MFLAEVYIVASAFKLKSPKKFRSLIQKLTHCSIVCELVLHSPIHFQEKRVGLCACVSLNPFL